MEQAFQTGYCEGDKIFYVSPLNWKGEEVFVDSYVDSWNAYQRFENEKFEHLLLGDPVLSFYQIVCLLCEMTITSYKFGYFTSNMCIMRILSGTT